MHPKDVNEMANSVDPDPTVPSGSIVDLQVFKYFGLLQCPVFKTKQQCCLMAKPIIYEPSHEKTCLVPWNF